MAPLLFLFLAQGPGCDAAFASATRGVDALPAGQRVPVLLAALAVDCPQVPAALRLGAAQALSAHGDVARAAALGQSAAAVLGDRCRPRPGEPTTALVERCPLPARLALGESMLADLPPGAYAYLAALAPLRDLSEEGRLLWHRLSLALALTGRRR